MTQPLALDSAPAGEAAGWRRNEDLIDALPYVDTLSDVEKAMVDKLIREEVRCHRPAPLSILPSAYTFTPQWFNVTPECAQEGVGGAWVSLVVTCGYLNRSMLALFKHIFIWL